MEGIQHRRFREVEHQRREGSGCARRIYNMGEGRQFYRRRATGTPADAISYATSSPARPFYRDLSRRGPQLRERAPSPSSRLITPEALGDAWTPTLPVQGVVGYIARRQFPCTFKPLSNPTQPGDRGPRPTCCLSTGPSRVSIVVVLPGRFLRACRSRFVVERQRLSFPYPTAGCMRLT